MTIRIPESFPCPPQAAVRPASRGRTASAFAGGGFRRTGGGVSGGMGFHRLHEDDSTPMTAGPTIGKAVVKPPAGPAAGGDPGG